MCGRRRRRTRRNWLRRIRRSLRQTLAKPMHARMLAAVKKQLQFDRQRLGALAGRRVLQSPLGYLQDRRMLLDHESRMLATLMQRAVAQKKQRFAHLRRRSTR